MDKILEKTKEIKDLIEQEPLIQEYRRVENLYKNNDEIKAILREIDNAVKDNNQPRKNELVEKFNSHPLVSNYMVLKQEVHEFLKEIAYSLNI